jgi:hypothetical protein
MIRNEMIKELRTGLKTGSRWTTKFKLQRSDNPKSSSPFDSTKERFFRLPGEIMFCSGLELSASENSWRSKGGRTFRVQRSRYQYRI